MERKGKNFKISSIAGEETKARETLHDRLELTGTEISLNELPAGASVPFVHAHKMNEEVYVILEGKGMLYVDGEELAVAKNDVVRLDPAAARCFKADEDSALKFICIQAQANSLSQFTQNDGVMVEVKPSWL